MVCYNEKDIETKKVLNIAKLRANERGQRVWGIEGWLVNADYRAVFCWELGVYPRRDRPTSKAARGKVCNVARESNRRAARPH
jgi:hypothetical protein